MMDLLCKERLTKRLEKHPHVDNDSIDEVVTTYLAHGERLKPFITDTSLEINKAITSGKRIIMEGAQGTMLDVDHGTISICYIIQSNIGCRLYWCWCWST